MWARCFASAMCRSSMWSARATNWTSRSIRPVSTTNLRYARWPGTNSAPLRALLRRLAQERQVGIGLVGLLDQLVEFRIRPRAAPTILQRRQIFVIILGEPGVFL